MDLITSGCSSRRPYVNRINNKQNAKHAVENHRLYFYAKILSKAGLMLHCLSLNPVTGISVPMRQPHPLPACSNCCQILSYVTLEQSSQSFPPVTCKFHFLKQHGKNSISDLKIPLRTKSPWAGNKQTDQIPCSAPQGFRQGEALGSSVAGLISH